jgi:hypothetical protein
MLHAMRPSDIEKVLEDQKSIEGRKRALIDELLKEKAAAVKEFDDKLAKLGYVDGAKPKRTHHKKPAQAAAGKSAAEKSSPEKPKT